MSQQQSWAPIDGTTFQVRASGYLQHSQKQPSLDSMLNFVAVELFSTPTKLCNIAHRLPLPSVTLPTNPLDLPLLPPYIVINLQMPAYDPPMFGQVEDGPGASLVFVLSVNQSVQREIASAIQSASQPANSANPRQAFLDALSPALRLLHNFVHADALPMNERTELRTAFKAITRVCNVDELNLTGVTASLITKSVHCAISV